MVTINTVLRRQGKADRNNKTVTFLSLLDSKIQQDILEMVISMDWSGRGVMEIWHKLPWHWLMLSSQAICSRLMQDDEDLMGCN